MKKISIMTIWIIILLVSCSHANSLMLDDESCNKSVCLKYSLSSPIKALEPVKLFVTVTAKEDIKDLGLAIYPAYPIEFKDFIRTQDGQKPGSTAERDMGWTFNAKKGEEYFFTGTLVFPLVPDKKIWQYWISIGVGGPTIGQLSFRPTIFINSEGNQVLADELNTTGPVYVDVGTPPPVVTDNPGMEFLTPPVDFRSTQQMLDMLTATTTITVTPTITPTLPGYPGP